MSDDEANEFYRKYRPKSPKEMYGQRGVLKSLQGMMKAGTIPHCLLFTGPSGCGKTTVCRMLAKKLGVSDFDYREINIANQTGVDGVREIESSLFRKPLKGAVKIYMLDECHQATKQAQECMLKMLEDTPKHVYFFLATTNPKKLISAIQTRATEFKLKALDTGQIIELCQKVAEKEGSEISEEVVAKIAKLAEGSARKALVLLQQALSAGNEAAQLEVLQEADNEALAIDLARALLNMKSKWSDICDLLKNFQDDPEGARRVILGYANSILLGGGRSQGRAYLVIDTFREPFFDTTAKALLAAGCYEIFCNKD